MFLWTTSRPVHKKKGLSLLNPSPPKSLLSPPVWFCLGSEMPALMNTNFPFRSIHQHVKLHFVSFCLFCCCFLLSPNVYIVTYFVDCLSLLIWMKIQNLWMLRNVTSNATIDTNGYLEFCAVIVVAVFDVKGSHFKVICFLEITKTSCGWQGLHSHAALFLFRPTCGRTTRRWWHGWRDSSLKKRAHDLLSMRTSSTSAEITSSSRYAGD